MQVIAAQNLKGVKKSRRDFLKLLPFTSAGAFLFSSYEFISSSYIGKKRYTILLDTLKDGINIFENKDIIINKSEDKFVVFSAHCTHLGCIIKYHKSKDIFICPCHHSKFTSSGERIEGPAKRNLDKIAFKIVNNSIVVG